MPRLNVIILDQDPDNTFRCAMWADVPVARQPFFANASNKSVWTGATAADNTALQSGSMVEKIDSQRVPSGASLAQIQNFLQLKWTAYQAFINSSNSWPHYGSTWDGTTWVMATVA